MTWAYPYMVLLWGLIPLLLYLRYARKRLPAVRFSDGRVLSRLPATWGVYVGRLAPVLYAGGLMLLILALAGPREMFRESTVDVEGIDIVLLIDISGSMRAEDFEWEGRRMNRIDAVKKVVEEFLLSRDHDRISLIAFAGVPYTLTPLTRDHDWLARQLDRIQFGMVTDGTAIGSAIASGVNRLRESDAESRVIILLTDGVNNAGTISPENAAHLAATLGIPVHAIGVGTQDLAPFPIRDAFGQTRYVQQLAVFDEDQLKRIADITGAGYFHAADVESLAEIYREIEELEKIEYEIEYVTRAEERFPLFLIPALCLLMLERLLLLSRFGRLP